MPSVQADVEAAQAKSDALTPAIVQPEVLALRGTTTLPLVQREAHARQSAPSRNVPAGQAQTPLTTLLPFMGHGMQATPEL